MNKAYDSLVTHHPDGTAELSLLVDGVHCALCIQKIESTLKQREEVESVRLNFTTRRLVIIWRGPAELADAYVTMIENLGYTPSPYHAENEKTTQDKENRFLLLCLGVAGFAMGNIMLLSVGLWSSSGEIMGTNTRTFLHWVSAIIAVPTILFSGRPFFRSAWNVLKQGHTNMDVPISLAILLATGMSLFEMTRHGEHVYFDSAVMLTFFLLIGRYLDFRARRHARMAATDLMQTLNGFATVLDGQGTRHILIRDLEQDMQVLIAAGEQVPVDGIVTKGTSSIDTSLITGETLPRTVNRGEQVYAGTINQSAPLRVTVSKSADDSLLADIVRLMEKAEQAQARYVRLADKAAKIYTPFVHILALLAFIWWFGFQGALWQDSLMIAVTVLIITCPCALGLAVPVVQVLASSLLMKKGVLVKSGDALERLARIDTVVFDKTGTLTVGQPSLVGDYAQEPLQLAASLAAYSAHPLSKALVRSHDGERLEIEEPIEHPGQGIEASHGGDTIKLGSRSWCGDTNQPDSETIEIWLSQNDTPTVCFSFEDRLKEDSAETVATLQDQGLKTILLSGDRASVAHPVAHAVGIESVHAEQTPADKHAILEELKHQGHLTLMVGDGLNDAPALAGASVSMAPGSAVDMAQNVADMVFMGNALKPVAATYHIARTTQRLIKQNFALAVAYNIVAVPLAFAGYVTPMIAAIAMSGSSLLVIANSYRLKWLA